MRDLLQCGWLRRPAAGKAKAAVPVTAVAIAVLAAGCDTGASPPAIAGPLASAAPLHFVRPARVSAAQMARLPMATTYATTPAAPRDLAPFAPETGIVVHPVPGRFRWITPVPSRLPSDNFAERGRCNLPGSRGPGGCIGRDFPPADGGNDVGILSRPRASWR
jgi:hypothetical protein